MVITRGALCALTLSLASAAHAEISWELAGVARHAERGEFFETDGSALVASYFFDPVEDDLGPYALASFLDPATHMTVALSEEEQTSRAQVQSGQLIESERDLRDWSMHVRQGRALAYALFGNVAETRLEVTVVAAPPPAGVAPSPPIFISEPPAGFIAADTQELEPRRTYTVGAELFPTRKLGVRIGYTVFDGALTEDDAYDVSATWFFRRNVGVGLSLSRQEFDYGLASSDSAAFRVIGRL